MSNNIKELLLIEISSSDRYSSFDEKYKNRCNEEIESMSSCIGLNSDTILEEFYNVYKNIGKINGSKNSINSVIAYCLGMSCVCPSLSDIFLPERRIFARIGFPDIDADFDYERRHEVYEYLIEKYGRERVGNIGTYGTLKMRSYITRVVKALDLSSSFNLGKESYVKNNNLLVREIIDSLPEQKGAFLKVKDYDGEDHVIKNISEASSYCENFKKYMDKYPQISQHSLSIEGLCSSYGVHAAGIVISEYPLATIAPLRATSKSDEDTKVEYATQFAYEDLEYIGLIKFDILALSTLSVMSETIKTIKDTLNIDIDIQKLPLNDASSFDLYKSGNLTGVFQCEERGMQKTMMQIGVDRFEDICAGIALFRPGPMASIPRYCARKKGFEPIEYFDVSIAKYVASILKPTYGVLVYQEQVMKICNSLAGMTISDGYQVIKAVGKKKEDQLNRYEDIFINGCEKNGIDRSVSCQYWREFIMPFASYGFNKCLSGDTVFYDAVSDQSWKISELAELKLSNNMPSLKLWSKDLINNEWFVDTLQDVFYTGEKLVFKVKFDNGIIVECTENHMFLCSEGNFIEVREIFEKKYKVELSDSVFGTMIESITELGLMSTFNCTMLSKHHNYAIVDKITGSMICSKNSHSYCYGLLSYQTAYFKANFPAEFILSYLNIECLQKKWDRIDVLLIEAKRMGMSISPKNINISKMKFQISEDIVSGKKKYTITPSIFCKGLKMAAAEEITKKQPFKNYEDFVSRVNTSIVDAEAVAALKDAGFFPKTKDAVDKFIRLRDHVRAARKKGMSGVDLFQ